MYESSFTILETPIGLIVPIWVNEPQFYLLRICIIDSTASIEHLFDELQLIGFDSDKLHHEQFLHGFMHENKQESVKSLFNRYFIFSEIGHRYIEQLKKSIELFFSSKIDIQVSPDLLCLDDFSEYTRSVLLSLKKIPFGQTLSYGRLAELSGHPKAYRAVGSVMNKNPFPLIIPCHRVIRSNGNIGEFALGKDMKDCLLKHESSN